MTPPLEKVDGAPAQALKQTTAKRPRPTTLPATVTRGRKVGVLHFSFLRAVLQGLGVRESWARYLAHEGEVALARPTLAWLREELAAAARKHDRFGTARLVRFDAARLTATEARLPSLAVFAEAHGLEDFSQAEQLAAYEAAHGSATKRLRQRARFMQRQLAALKWLEAWVAQPPHAGDAVAAWLHPSLAAHLEAADIFTLAQLAERINGIGLRWYRGLRGLGEGKAARIVAWLRAQEPSTGLGLGPHVALARRKVFASELAAVVQPATAIRPLEKLLVPAELDGRQGLYRRPQAQCLLKATNDYQAILAWLQSKHSLTAEQKAAARARRRQRDNGVEQRLDWLQTLSHTQRSYRKEAERFLLWAIVQQGKPLSSMSTVDCVAYRDFLGDPQPRSRWCGERSRERWSPLWRPFEGPLSAAGQGHAITVLKNLYAFLSDANYLMGNPWRGVSLPRAAQPRMNPGRSLTMAQWQFALAHSARRPAQAPEESPQDVEKPEPATAVRLRFVLAFLYATGLRLSEAVAARVDDVTWVTYPPDAEDDELVEGWVLQVVGKGGRLREVPLPVELGAALAAYLRSRGLDPDPEHLDNRGAYLLGKASDFHALVPQLAAGVSVDPKAGIVANTLYDQLKRFFTDCARALREKGDHAGAARFERASTHWLRHTHASHSIAKGTKIEIEQEILGHASLATTTVYVTTEAKRRMKAMAAFAKG